jgi:mycoredoxin
MTIEKPSSEKMIVFGHDYCGQSRTLVRALKQKEIEYEWRDIHNGDPAWKDQLRELARGYLSVPTVIFPDGKVMVEPWPEEVMDHLQIHRPGLLDKLSNLFKRDE